MRCKSRLWCRVFPASAGVILLRTSRCLQHRGFPRIRGGDPLSLATVGGLNLVFPASAGVIRRPHEPQICAFGFPRIRGGDPFSCSLLGVTIMFSPHPRG